MLKLPNSIEPAVMAENIVHLRDAESSLNGRVSDLEVTAPKDYSTTETATGQKWINGKDIYMKVYYGETQETQTTETIDELNYNFIQSYFWLKSASNNWYCPGSGAFFLCNDTAGKVNIEVGNIAFASRPYIAILYYTKPDPTPGRAPEDSDQEPEPEEKKTTKKKTTK